MTKHPSNTFRTWQSFLVLLIFTCLCTIGCSKSSSNGSTIPPPCGDTCLLLKNTWELDSIETNCSAGTFGGAYINTNPIDWSTFTFYQNLSFSDYFENGSYSWTGAAQIAITSPSSLPLIHFNVTVSSTSLALATLKVQLHPQVDTGYEAKGEVDNILPGLHDQFQVDTSKLTYVETTFYYSAKK